jgi:hypothetical protein
MRTRSRYSRTHAPGAMGYSQTRKDTGALYSAGDIYFPVVFNDKVDVITDKVRAKRSREDRARDQRRLASAQRLLKGTELRSVKSDLYTELLTVNPCTHTKTAVSPSKDGSLTILASSAIHNHSITYSGMSPFLYHVGGVSINQKLTTLMSQARLGNIEGFHDHDWFALLDQWHEACNNLMSPDTNLGESIVENGIFVDAFKTVLNPSRGLKYLVNFVKGNLGNHKYSGLGKIGRLLRDSSDASLSYKFGIKPALEEVQRMLTAQKVVSRRMKYLRENVGGYIPIRARQVLPSEVTVPPGSLDGNILALVYNTRESTAVISALGKIRPDLSYAEDWQAYVQYFGLHKVFGLAWELVPFSFVIDWVTNAQEYVNKYMTPKFDSPFYNIRNICHSVRKRTLSSYMMGKAYRYSTWSATRPAGSEPVELCRLTETSYSRAPGLPTTSGSVDFSRLGLFHGMTSGSLLLQKAGGLFKKS